MYRWESQIFTSEYMRRFSLDARTFDEALELSGADEKKGGRGWSNTMQVKGDQGRSSISVSMVIILSGCRSTLIPS